MSGALTTSSSATTTSLQVVFVKPLALPWRILAHDNHRMIPVVQKGRARLITAPAYREAKRAVEQMAALWWREAKLTGPLELHAKAWFPDNRKRDAGNYRKLITDALSGIVYADDSQLVREVWERCGIDKLNPRIEVWISTLASSPSQAA